MAKILYVIFDAARNDNQQLVVFIIQKR